MTATGKYCLANVATRRDLGLSDCKAYCIQNGSKMITYYPRADYCRCCTEDDILRTAILTEIYTYRGSYVYVNIHAHVSTIYKPGI